MYTWGMSRKRVLTFAVLAIFAMMVGAAMFEAFDVHDTKPFPIDPEFMIMTLGFFLALCVSVVLLMLPSLADKLMKAVGLLFPMVRSTCPARPAFERDGRLFSPPRRPISLRI